MGWVEGDYVHNHIIYLGTSNPPDSLKIQASATFKPEALDPNTTYYWRIDEFNAFGSAEGPVWSFTTGQAGSGDEVVLDYCDSDGGWNSSNGIILDTEEKQEGYASLKSEGAGTDWYKKTFATPVNSYCDTTSYLDLWLYVSDVSKFDGGGQLEITSAGKADTDEFNWAVGELGLVNGWNDLHLRIGDASIMGEPDLSSINFFRLYQFLSGDVITRIDYIRFSGLVYEAMSAPLNLTATPGDASVSLDWDDNTESSLGGYNIYRANYLGLSYSKINTEPVPSSDYTDQNLTNGSAYYYYVTAQDTVGNESESSIKVSATPSASSLVSDNQDIGAEIYPNPVGELLHIRVENGISARVFDLTGRLVKTNSITGQETVINVSDLLSGVYVIEVNTLAGAGLYKLIKR